MAAQRKSRKKYTVTEAEKALLNALPSAMTMRDTQILSNFKKCLVAGEKVWQ